MTESQNYENYSDNYFYSRNEGFKVILTFCWAFMFFFMAQMGFHTGETEKQQTFVDVVGVAALGGFHQRTVRLGGAVEQQAVLFASVFVGFEHGHVAPSAFREQSTGGTSVY